MRLKSVEISGFAARVVVTQRFENPFPDPIEAVYTFPLSERAAVDGMWMRTGDREIRGEIARREQARRVYEEITSANARAQSHAHKIIHILACALPLFPIRNHIGIVIQRHRHPKMGFDDLLQRHIVHRRQITG